MKRKNYFLKYLLIFCLIFNAYSTCIYGYNKPSLSSPIMEMPEYLTIPSHLGFMVNTHQIDNFLTENDKKLIIYIQDAHCNFEAQVNTGKILKKLLSGENPHDLDLIEIEGGSGYFDTSLLSSIPDKDLRQEIAVALLSVGKINGAEFLAITDPGIARLHGAEDLKLYFKNFNHFRKNLSNQAYIMDIVNELDSSLDKIQESLETPELKKLSKVHTQYEKQQIGFDEYIHFLYQKTKDLGISEENYPNIGLLMRATSLLKKVDNSIFQKEHQKIIDQASQELSKERLAEILTKTMYYRLERISPESYFQWLCKTVLKEANLDKKNFPNLIFYTQYLAIFKRIDKQLMLHELEEIFYQVRLKQAKTLTQKKLYKFLKSFAILKNLYRLELSRSELSFYQKHPDTVSFSLILEFINEFSHLVKIREITTEDMKIIQQQAAEAELFYESARLRDNALVEHTLAQMDQDNARIAVLIAGGFHTKGILKLMEARGVSYIVISPRITDFKAKTPYLSIMQDQRSPFEASVEKVKSSMNYSQGPKAHNAAIATTSSFQPDSELESLLKSGDLQPEVRELIVKKMQMISFFNLISLSYVEIALVIKKLKETKGLKNFESLQPVVQDILDKWAEFYFQTAKSRGADDAELLRIQAEYEDFDKSIDVVGIEGIGNRIFINLSVFGRPQGLVLNPSMDGKDLLLALNSSTLYDSDTFSLLIRAQRLVHEFIAKGSEVSFSMLKQADPELALIENILQDSPFLIELEEVAKTQQLKVFAPLRKTFSLLQKMWNPLKKLIIQTVQPFVRVLKNAIQRIRPTFLAFFLVLAGAIAVGMFNPNVAAAQDMPPLPPQYETTTPRENTLFGELSFNQSPNYRLRLDQNLSDSWHFQFLYSNSGLFSDTLDPLSLQIIEDNATLLGLVGGYLGPMEYARANRELPISSDLFRLRFSYRRSPESPFWLSLNAGVNWFRLPVLEGDEYHFEAQEVRPSGGIDLGWDYRFMRRPWMDWKGQILLGVHYQEMLRDRMIIPEGVDSTHLIHRNWADFYLANSTLRLTPLMETGIDAQGMLNAYLRGLYVGGDATNDEIAREIIAWGTRYGGIMAFPYDDRGGPIIAPDNLLGALELQQHGVMRFISTPAIWHTFEGRVDWQPWRFLRFHLSGGVDLVWRPELEFRLSELPDNLNEDQLREWTLDFQTIPLIRGGIAWLIYRDLELSGRFEGRWVEQLPFSRRMTWQLAWEPRFLPNTRFETHFRWSNYTDRFGTLQTFSSSDEYNFGFNGSVSWSPIESKGREGSFSVAEISMDKKEDVSLTPVIDRSKKVSSNFLYSFYRLAKGYLTGLKLKLIQPLVKDSLSYFEKVRPEVNLKNYKIFLSDSNRMGSIIHLDDEDSQIHLNQKLFSPFRAIWIRLLKGLGFKKTASKISKRWNELISFILTHEAVRHPRVNIEDSTIHRYSQDFPKVYEYYREKMTTEQQRSLRDLLEEAVVMLGDIVEDFIPSSPERKLAILEALVSSERNDPAGKQAYKDLLEKSMFLKPDQILPAIIAYLLRDPKNSDLVPKEVRQEFMRLAERISTAHVIPVVPSERPEPIKISRRVLFFKVIKASVALMTSGLLVVCGVPDGAWNLMRHERVFIEEDTSSAAVSTVAGATISSIDPLGNIGIIYYPSPEETFRRMNDYGFVVEMDPSAEPNPDQRFVSININLAVIPPEELGNAFFPQWGNLNDLSLEDFTYVTNGIPHTLIFTDSDDTSYQIPINIRDADPEKLYRITIEQLLKALNLNGMRVAETDVSIFVNADQGPFVFTGFVPNPEPVPMMTGKTGKKRKSVAHGLIDKGVFRWVDRMQVQAEKLDEYDQKINKALGILALHRNLQLESHPMILTEDNNHFLDFNSHIGIDTDFFDKDLYSAPLLALLFDHEIAHAKGANEIGAIFSNGELYPELKKQYPEAFPEKLIEDHPYLQLLENLAGRPEEEKLYMIQRFMQEYRDLFTPVTEDPVRAVNELNTLIAQQASEWKLPVFQPDLAEVLRNALNEESPDMPALIQDNTLDKTIMEIINQLTLMDTINLKDIMDMASLIVEKRSGQIVLEGYSISEEAMKDMELDLAILLVQIFGFIRSSYLQESEIRNIISGTKVSLASIQVYEIFKRENKIIIPEENSFVKTKTLRITTEGDIFVNESKISGMSNMLRTTLKVFINDLNKAESDLILEFTGHFDPERIKTVLSVILSDPASLADGITLSGFDDGSLVYASLNENRLIFLIESQFDRWADAYKKHISGSWQRVEKHLRSKSPEEPSVKAIVLGADTLSAQLTKKEDGTFKVNVDPTAFLDLYDQTRVITHPDIPGSAIKLALTLVVDEKLSSEEKEIIKSQFITQLFVSRPEWLKEAGENVLVHIIVPEEEQAGENIVKSIEDTLLKGRYYLDRTRDLMLILSQRENDRLSLRDVVPWIINGRLDKKRLYLIAELLAADGKPDEMAQEVIEMIENIDDETLTDLNNRQLTPPTRLYEQLQLQNRMKKMIETMA